MRPFSFAALLLAANSALAVDDVFTNYGEPTNFPTGDVGYPGVYFGDGTAYDHSTIGQTFQVTEATPAVKRFSFYVINDYNTAGGGVDFIAYIYRWVGYRPKAPALFTSEPMTIPYVDDFNTGVYRKITIDVGNVELIPGYYYVIFLDTHHVDPQTDPNGSGSVDIGMIRQPDSYPLGEFVWEDTPTFEDLLDPNRYWSTDFHRSYTNARNVDSMFELVLTDDAPVANPQNISIDVLPGNADNKVYPNKTGKLPVAILSSAEFDATQVDPATLKFGAAEASIAEPVSIQNIDGQHGADTLARFNVEESGILCNDTEVSLTGQTYAGEQIAGTDSIDATACQTGGCHAYP